MTILPVGAELLHADGRTDRYDETKEPLFVILRKRLTITSVRQTKLFIWKSGGQLHVST